MPLYLLPILAHALSVTASDVSESRLRFDQAGEHVDLSTTGRLVLDLRQPRVAWSLSYSLNISELSVGETSPLFTILHTGSLGARLQLSRRTTLSFTETASYGRLNFRALSVSSPVTSATSGSSSLTPLGPTTPTTPLVPVDRTIRYGSVSSGVGVSHVISPSWSTDVGAGLLVGGQLDSEQPAVIPRSRTLFGGLLFTNVLDRNDRLGIGTNVMQVHTQPSGEAFLLRSDVAWSRTLSRSMSLLLAPGVAYFELTDLRNAHRSAVVPTTLASWTWAQSNAAAGSRTALSVTGSAMPRVDFLYGGVSEMATVGGDFSWTQSRVTLQFSGEGGHSVHNYGGVALISNVAASQAVIVQLDRRQHWTTSFGAREAKQTFAEGPPLPTLIGIFAMLSYTTGPITL